MKSPKIKFSNFLFVAFDTRCPKQIAELEQLVAECQADAVEFEGKYLEFPAMPTPPEDAETTELPSNFSALLEQASLAVQREAGQEVLRGINLSKYGITAANSKMLVHFPCPVTLTKDVTLPFPEPLLAEQIAEKGSLQLWENNFLLETGPLKWQGKVLEGEYPDWRTAVPSKQNLTFTAELPEPEKIIDWLKSIPKQEKEDFIELNSVSDSSLEATAYNRPEHKLSLTFPPQLPGCVRLDRESLLNALQLGFTTLEIADPLNPVCLSGRKGFSVIVTVRKLSQPCQSERKKGILGKITPWLVLLLLLWIGKAALTSEVENFAARQIQQCAIKLTGREVKVASVTYNLWKQHLEIKNIAVPNPPEFPQGTPAIRIERVSLKLVPWAIFKDLVHITELNISEVSITAALKKTPKSFKELVQVLRSPEINLAKLKTDSTRKKRNTSAQSKSVFIKIDKLQITNVRAEIDSKWRLGFPLPDYSRNALGADGKLTPDKLAAEIYNIHIQETKLKVFRCLREIKENYQNAAKKALEKIRSKYTQKKEK